MKNLSLLTLSMVAFALPSLSASQGASASGPMCKQREQRSVTPVSKDNAWIVAWEALHNHDTDKLREAATLLHRMNRLDDRKNRHTLLMEAATMGYDDGVCVLLSEGAALDAKNYIDDTALHCASEAGQVGVVNILLQAGADVSACNAKGESLAEEDEIVIYRGNTPLHVAANAACVRCLLEAGADINLPGVMEESALHRAKNPEVVLALVARGANVTARDQFGRFPLNIASTYDHRAAFLAMVACGAPLTVVNPGDIDCTDGLVAEEEALVHNREVIFARAQGLMPAGTEPMSPTSQWFTTFKTATLELLPEWEQFLAEEEARHEAPELDGPFLPLPPELLAPYELLALSVAK